MLIIQTLYVKNVILKTLGEYNRNCLPVKQYSSLISEILSKNIFEGTDLTNEELLIIHYYRKSNDLTKDIFKKIIDYDDSLVNFPKGLQ